MKTNIIVNPYTIYQVDTYNNKLNIVEITEGKGVFPKHTIIKSYDLNTIVKIVDKIEKGELNVQQIQ